MRTGYTGRFFLLAGWSLAWLGAGPPAFAGQVAPTPAPVVLVCEHGNVKSLIGASLFNQAAQREGLPFRAVSRGLNPGSDVPPDIADALRRDGIEVAGFKPQPLTVEDVSTASRVVAIGVDLASFGNGSKVPIDAWNDVPPASVDYAASKDALLRHVVLLLDQMQAAGDLSIGKLEWLAGCWQRESAEPGSGEHWMSPAGGTMLGMSRTVRQGKTIEYEFMQVHAQPDGAFAFTALPSGQPMATFPLVHLSESEVVFENPAHDFPQRVAYRRESPSKVVGRIEGVSKGAARVVEFPMLRVHCETGGSSRD